MLEIALIIMACCAVFTALFPIHRKRWLSGVLAVVMCIALAAGYVYFGNGPAIRANQLREAQLATVNAALKSYRGTKGVIHALKARLDHTSKSARGWYLLGRLYASEGQWLEAQSSFHEAYRLQPQEEALTQYAMSSWQVEHQHLSVKTRQLFQNILKDNPKQPDALMVLAMDAYAHQQDEAAIEYWQRLLTLVPDESDDAQVIRQAIAKAEIRLRS